MFLADMVACLDLISLDDLSCIVEVFFCIWECVWVDGELGFVYCFV